MNLKRFRYIGLAVPLLVILWLVWPKATKDDGVLIDKPGSSSTGGVTTTKPVLDVPSTGPSGRDRVRDRPSSPSTSARVERILSDDHISTDAAAVMLHEIVADASLPVEDRLEALTHGLNLDITPFANDPAVPELPAPLAARFLEAVINHNQSPQLQIQAYMSLIHHPDPEVAKTATDMLAFMVDDDAREADKPTLLQMGQKKLEDLRKPASESP